MHCVGGKLRKIVTFIAAAGGMEADFVLFCGKKWQLRQRTPSHSRFFHLLSYIYHISEYN